MAGMVDKKTNKKVSKNPRKMKILMVSAEALPYASVGGVGSVVCHLAKALAKLGHDVRIFLPKFGLIDESKHPMTMVSESLKVPTDDPKIPELICNVKCLRDESGVTYYFLENMEYYEKRANVYGYSDDPTRFLLLSRGVLEFIKQGDFVPNIIHCNDWHTGSLPYYLRTSYSDTQALKNVSCLFTIHSLAHQGMLDHRHVSELNYDDGKSPIGSFFASRVNTLNYMRRGILFADAVNTVSKNYAREILTPDYGEGLDKLLLELEDKLFGIINGINYDDMNPMTDPLLEKNYDMKTLELRGANKKALQKHFDLPVDEKKFVLGFLGRLDHQKGVDLLIRVLRELFREREDVQFVQIGGGDWGLSEQLKCLKEEFPKRVGIHPYPNFTLPRLFFSGVDCALLPSRFEPCGIVQIECMRYGCIPIVRGVGGLADTVKDFDSVSGSGTGFVFRNFSDCGLYGQIIRALDIFKHKDLWKKLQLNAMKSDYSWEYSAKEYVKLYKKSQLLKNKKLFKNSSLSGLVG